MVNNTLAPRTWLRLVAALMVFSTAFLTSGASPAVADDELLKYVPPGANALVVIDVDSLLRSRMGISEGWGDRSKLEYSERPILVPPEAQTAVVAAQLDAGNQLARVWELAVLRLKEEVALDHIARTEGGYVDTINETQVVWTPSEAFIVDLGAPELGIVYPADRQYVSRWAGFARSNQTPVISEYLKAAADQVSPTAQIVMALDLLDAPDPHRIETALSTSETLAGNQKRQEQLAPIITGIRGITLTIHVSTQARGVLRLDFSDDVAPFSVQAKPLVLEALDRFGAHIPDMDIWVTRTEGQTIEMEGVFSESGLRRITSLLEVPTQKFSELHDDQPAEEGSDDYTSASLAYYRGVKALLDDLRETLSDERDNQALWMERFARKVDAMPILNVDDELLDWGATVGETFRSMGLAVRQSGIRGGVRTSQARGSDNRYYGGYSNYGRYGYYVGDDSQSRTNVIRAEERGQERMSRYENWNELENATADIRRRMTQKYGVEF